MNQLLLLARDLLARESVDFLPCGSPLSLAVVSSCHWLALFRFQPTRNIRRVSSKSNIFCGITNQTSRNLLASFSLRSDLDKIIVLVLWFAHALYKLTVSPTSKLCDLCVNLDW